MGAKCSQFKNERRPDPVNAVEYLRDPYGRNIKLEDIEKGNSFVEQRFCAPPSHGNPERRVYCSNLSDRLKELPEDIEGLEKGPKTSSYEEFRWPESKLHALLSKGEWKGEHCHYVNAQDIPYRTGLTRGCCGAECVFNYGNQVECVRFGYLGNPVSCCFRDAASKSDKTPKDKEEKTNASFETKFKRRTCDPEYRDIRSEKCRVKIRDYCVGAKTFYTQNSWLDIWSSSSSVEVNSHLKKESEKYPKNENLVVNETNWGRKLVNDAVRKPNTNMFKERYDEDPGDEKQPCLRAILRNVSNGDYSNFYDLKKGGLVATQINPEGSDWSQGVLQEIIQKYINEYDNFVLRGVNQPGIGLNDFENTIWEICHTLPYLCKDILNDLCSEVTEETILNNPNQIFWCGCYMQNKEYDKYENRYLISRECTPYCNRPGVIPVVDSNNFPKICTQNVCILSDNTVNLFGSQSEGGVNFNQVCNTCGASNIKTFIGGAVFKEEFSEGDDSFSDVTKFQVIERSVESSKCFCVVDGSNINLINSKFKSLNVNTNCGNSECYDTEGKLITCGAPTLSDDNIEPLVVTIRKVAREKMEKKFKDITYVLIAAMFLFFFLLGASYLLKKTRKFI